MGCRTCERTPAHNRRNGRLQSGFVNLLGFLSLLFQPMAFKAAISQLFQHLHVLIGFQQRLATLLDFGGQRLPPLAQFLLTSAKRYDIAMGLDEPVEVHVAGTGGFSTLFLHLLLFQAEPRQLIDDFLIGFVRLGQSCAALIARRFAEPK